MYAGRLEVVTVFALFAPGWWRRPRYDRGFQGVRRGRGINRPVAGPETAAPATAGTR